MLVGSYLGTPVRFKLGLIFSCLMGFGLLLPSAAEAQTKKNFVLKFATLDPPNSILGRGEDWYLKRVEELSGGQIKFERHWGGSLVPPRQALEAVKSGVVDVGFLIAQWNPDKLPLLTVQTLPTDHREPWIVGMAFQEYAQKSYAKNELANQNAVFLMSIPLPTYNLLLKKPVNSLDQLKGLKLWASGEQADLLRALGAVPVTIPTPEVYTALERGTLDGAAYPPLLIVDFGLQGAAKHLWRVPLGMKSSFLAINQDVWKSLSGDLQNIMQTAATEALKHGAAYHQIVQQEGNEKEAVAKIKSAGVNITDPTSDAEAAVRTLYNPIWDAWVAKMESSKLPGKQASNDYRALLEKYSGQVPK
jgi:TRAP-type C4-dicarboxylate transport system substrate-binding protein